MQRSITYKNPLAPLLYVALFALYSSLSSIYLFLPPLLAVLFIVYANALKKEDFSLVVFIGICLVIVEANNDYPLFSTIMYFTLAYKFIMPKIEQNFNCNSCVKISYSLLGYIGYYLFLLILSEIFLLPPPSVNYYIIYYIVIEFFLVSLL